MFVSEGVLALRVRVLMYKVTAAISYDGLSRCRSKGGVCLDYCPITYTFEVIPDPGDPAIFTFDDTNLIHTIVTSDIAKAGVYTV